jgi:hypothetical protein
VKRLASGTLVPRAAVLALLVIGAVPASASAQDVSLLTTGRSLTVPPGASSELTLSCPGSAVALNGSPITGPAHASIPGSNPRHWIFEFSSDATDTRERASVGLRCLRMRLPAGIRRVRLFTGTVTRSDFAVPAGSTHNAELSCRRGQLATGWGLESQTPRALSLRAADPIDRGFAFAVQNVSAADAVVTLRVRCLGRVARAGNGDTARFRTRIASFRDRGAKRSVKHSCRRDEASLATGVELTTGPLLERTYPAGTRGGRWRFSAALGDDPARTTLVCLALATRFR